MNAPLKETKDSKKEQENPAVSSPDKEPSNKNLFNKNLATSCILCVLISAITSFVVIKVGLNHQDEKMQDIIENYNSIDSKVKAATELISSINATLNSIRADLKSNKDDLSYMYTSLSSLQKDMIAIKKELHMTTENSDDIIKKLPSDKASFIESFENLIKDGVPFDSFIESNSSQIDMQKYASSNELMGFGRQKIKSINDLEKDFAAVGLKVFNVKTSESFWEKQKRFIKKKFSEMITIRNTSAKEEKIDKTQDDKELYEIASKQFLDGKIEDSLAALEKIKIENEELSVLISGMRKRVDLDKAFVKFKKEFVEVESKS
ncbi:MAG: hypothetical protein LBM19_00075 [Holosporales bacterium]|nr:hypothetical protein [Holosporales bacterium]